MLKKIEEIFSIPDLRKRILMTFLLLAVFRLGTHIPTPGVNGEALSHMFANASGNLLGFFDMFTGGALQKLTVFALGVMPYISASIILELLTVVIPHLAELKKRGSEGREKITRYTRYFTVIISFFQGFAIAVGIESMQFGGIPVVMDPGFTYRLITALTLTTGTVFLMWLGEKITSFGVGNGMSLIIMAGIISSFPGAVIKTSSIVSGDSSMTMPLVLALIIMAAALVAIVFMETSQRRIPIQYVRKSSMGGKLQTANSYLPFKLNPAGVIPIIFASTIVTLPPTIGTFLLDPNNPGAHPLLEKLVMLFSPQNPLYFIAEMILIIFFTYFYTSIIFNPKDIAENIQKSGGVIPGQRPGEATAGFIDYVLSRLTFVGAVYLAIVAILPQLIIGAFKMPFYFGGTSVLIVVGVGLDVIQKIEAHLITNNYDGFLRKGRIRGRRG